MTQGADYPCTDLRGDDSDGNGLPINLDDTGVHSVEAVLTVIWWLTQIELRSAEPFSFTINRCDGRISLTTAHRDLL